MDWAFNNLADSLLILGIVLLVIEVGVLGFSTFVLFFVGCAAVITAGLLYTGLMPETLLAALLSTGILTALSAILLWKPLKNMQSKVDISKPKGDLVGHSFVLQDDVSPQLTPTYRYSGIDWKLQSSETLVKGTLVEVTDASVGIFTIQAIVDS
ncbi:NfeD family protein [Paraglaciecola aquimarina]|uniref:NfeD family protein n=1 Tax=Paraglaciecola aquimarina TaxID=1235557 RepID=A0ABU3SSV5_9ALTE|nr:NfeD family protein [Paraglaciecola aquimarina]MDU0353099.1 NfeD family protein [Paraglaciecola aquimarina]